MRIRLVATALAVGLLCLCAGCATGNGPTIMDSIAKIAETDGLYGKATEVHVKAHAPIGNFSIDVETHYQ